MKRITVLLVLFLTFFIACNKKDGSGIDLVNGVEPIHQWGGDHQNVLDALKNIPDAEKIAYLEKHWPTLKNDVVYWIQRQNYLPQDITVDSVVFLYGSGKGSAYDKNGTLHKDGHFEDQVVAAIYIKGKDVTKPYLFFVRCTNGYVDPVDLNLRRIGAATAGFFTILPKQGLCHHVDYETSIELAERIGLPVYYGKTQSNQHRISYAYARALKDKTDQIQVTVHVETGDTFDLNRKEYNGKKWNE